MPGEVEKEIARWVGLILGIFACLYLALVCCVPFCTALFSLIEDTCSACWIRLRNGKPNQPQQVTTASTVIGSQTPGQTNGRTPREIEEGRISRDSTLSPDSEIDERSFDARSFNSAGEKQQG